MIYGKTWDDFVEEHGKDVPGFSFPLKECIVGVRVKVGGRWYLVGDINTNRGECDDCAAFWPEAIVEEYILPTQPEPTA